MAKNPKYIEIDNTFYSTLIITNYFREQDDLILKSIIDDFFCKEHEYDYFKGEKGQNRFYLEKKAR